MTPVSSRNGYSSNTFAAAQVVCLSAGRVASQRTSVPDKELQSLACNLPRTPRCTEDLIWFCVDTSSVVNFLNMSQNKEDICTALIAT